MWPLGPFCRSFGTCFVEGWGVGRIAPGAGTWGNELGLQVHPQLLRLSWSPPGG